MAQGNFDRLWESVADAVKDVREKVVEEPWYGRSLGGGETELQQWPQAQEMEPSFGSSTHIREGMEPNRDNNQEREIDIDR